VNGETKIHIQLFNTTAWNESLCHEWNEFGVQVGSVRVTPGNKPRSQAVFLQSERHPPAEAIFSFRNLNEAVTVSEAGVAATPQGSFVRMYMESSGANGQVGSIQSGFAVATLQRTPSAHPSNLTKLDGSSVGLAPAAILIPPVDSVSRFINELFPTLPSQFQRYCQLTTALPVRMSWRTGTIQRTRSFSDHNLPPLM